MASATDTTVTVKIDPNATSLQSDIIGPATSKSAGVMTAAQATKLEGISPADLDTLAGTYDSGSSSADQTMLIDATKGGGVIAQAKAALAGRLLAALDSVGGVILDAIDAAIPIVKLAGAFVQNDPGFGSPVMGSQTPGGQMSYTSDGNGATFGGTGMTVQQNGVDSIMRLTLNDTSVMLAYQDVPFFNNYGCDVPDALTIAANTIAPTKFLNTVGGAGPLKTITPLAGVVAIGSNLIACIPTFAFSWDASDNIALGGTAVVGKLLLFVFNGNDNKWYPSYIA